MRLSRTTAAAPVRIVHLGLGNFFRAHQAWYTAHAPDAQDWGIAAFTGRSAKLADTLSAQDGVYTLITREAKDEFEVVSSISRAHGAGKHDAWLRYLASPDTRVVTLTVTEAGYTRDRDGGLDTTDPAVAADLTALRRGAPVRTAVARLVAGLAARRDAGAGPIAVVPCDNLPGNGEVLARLTAECADLVAPGCAEVASFVTTMVDRITPATTGADLATAEAATGYRDEAPVVTEPFSEWVLSGEFPGGRPQWSATFTDDVMPYERRKLWLLNGAHSLLAYTAALRGHRTVGEAVADEVCRSWLAEWWQEAVPHLDLPAADLDAYCRALLTRFANPGVRHQLAQIAMDGSQKLPARILPVLREERDAGRLPRGAVRLLAGWVCHLTGAGVPVSDPGAAGVRDERDALALLDLAGDEELRAAVAAEANRLRG
ncbi:mannitol dehydrogenase family protein [Amycolatopsis sp. K13G38]|uniref:Mannitol dehydrogenase family protein n=1 Tax=Amycolatopsis acididurans TaxID=2724524 RepID=A0ABX1J319_9PSEU|nr:mannitol dehydrogenase family protein [Amycolatopsis acididurans]NKQ52681.1 mannitol dehydrogenase family protein [Amycolatopsis acididurans]